MRKLLRRVLAYVAFLLGLPFLLGHPKLRAGTWERLGHYRHGFPNVGDGPRVWLHGASAGDVLALRPLALELAVEAPQARLILTTITNSGRAMAEKHRDVFHDVAYLPFDLAGAVARAIRTIAPQVLVLEYTELWPELITSAHARGVKLVLHNGRLAADRVNGYRWLFGVVGNLLREFDRLLMRDESEADRATLLGAAPGSVRVTGNTKFDTLVVAADPAKVAELREVLAVPEGSLVWVAGSTHEGEEEHLFDVFRRLRAQHPTLRMVVAPRYLERVDRLIHLAQRRELPVGRRSAGARDAALVILDTIGELRALYELATVVFVGGSFVRRGGQNILEPAAAGKPVLFGPNMDNFADSVQVLLGRGGIQVATPEQLERVLSDLLARPDNAADLGATARRQVLEVRGAANRNAKEIAALLT